MNRVQGNDRIGGDIDPAGETPRFDERFKNFLGSRRHCAGRLSHSDDNDPARWGKGKLLVLNGDGCRAVRVAFEGESLPNKSAGKDSFDSRTPNCLNRIAERWGHCRNSFWDCSARVPERPAEQGVPIPDSHYRRSWSGVKFGSGDSVRPAGRRFACSGKRRYNRQSGI